MKVEASHRGQNIGGMLMASALRAGQQLGRSRVTLASQDDGSGRLTRWYQRMGFERAGINALGYPNLQATIGRVLASVAQAGGSEGRGGRNIGRAGGPLTLSAGSGQSTRYDWLILPTGHALQPKSPYPCSTPARCHRPSYPPISGPRAGGQVVQRMRKGEKKKGEKKKGEKKKSGEGKARQQTGFQSKYKEKSHLLIALEARCKVAEPDVFAEAPPGGVEEWNQNRKRNDSVTFIDLSFYQSLPLYFEATDEFLEKRASAKPPDIPGDWKTKVFGVNPGVHVRGDLFWFAAFTAVLEGGAFLYEGITSENYFDRLVREKGLKSSSGSLSSK